MKYIVYCTVNKINNKIYIGVHKTEDPDKWDHYLGCGCFDNSPKSYNKRDTAFCCAVAKYGPKNFIRLTIKVFETIEEALDLESKIVTMTFLKRNDVYNQTVGGGYPPSSEKEIYQYDLNGNFIKKWKSIKSIVDHFNINKDRIRMVINAKRSFYASYWSEEFFNKLDISDYRPSSRGSIMVFSKNGELINTFINTTEAAKQLDIDRRKITNAIYGKYSTNGYYFLKECENIEMYLNKKHNKDEIVFQYDKNGNFIKKFNSITDIKKEYKINKNDLKRAIKNNKFLNGFYWSFFKYNNILNENTEIINNIKREVFQYDKNDNFIKKWESISECKKEYPSVLQVCLGKRTHCKGFKFSFSELMIQSDTTSNSR